LLRSFCAILLLDAGGAHIVRWLLEFQHVRRHGGIQCVVVVVVVDAVLTIERVVLVPVLVLVRMRLSVEDVARAEVRSAAVLFSPKLLLLELEDREEKSVDAGGVVGD